MLAVADVDAHRADCDAGVAVDAIANWQSGGRSLLGVAAAWLAAPVIVGHGERVLVEHRGLNARPGAHIGANLLSHEAAKNIGRDGQDRDGDVGDRSSRAVKKLAKQRRSIGKIENPGAARGDCDQQPDKVLDSALGQLLSGPVG